MTPRRKQEDPDEERGRKEDASSEVPGGAERVALLEAVAAGLEGLLPGIELLDTDLAFDEGGRADLACMDEEGRLLLVLLAEGEAERVEVEALEALSFATRHLDLVWSHLGSPARAKRDVRMVLVAPDGGDVLARRVAPLCELGLEVFGMRTISSARGERSYLVRLDARGAEEPSRGSRLDSFLGRVPDAVRDTCRAFVARMERLDETLVADVRSKEIVWRSGGRPLARLEVNGRGVVGAVLDEGGDVAGTRVTIADADSADRLLEDAMAALLGVSAPGPGPRVVPALGPAPGDVGRGLPDEGAGLGLDEPLLTPEEIEAFRE